jgi:GGDEF domain-containing protein
MPPVDSPAPSGSEAARTDALTGLLNRRGFDETVVHAFLCRLGSPARSAFDAAL